MANQRKEGKKKLQIWMTDAEREGLKSLSQAHGFDTVTAFLQAVAEGSIKTSPNSKSESSGKRAKPKSAE